MVVKHYGCSRPYPSAATYFWLNSTLNMFRHFNWY